MHSVKTRHGMIYTKTRHLQIIDTYKNYTCTKSRRVQQLDLYKNINTAGF